MAARVPRFVTAGQEGREMRPNLSDCLRVQVALDMIARAAPEAGTVEL